MTIRRRRSPQWNAERLRAYGEASSFGYVPGMKDDQVCDDHWTTEKHLQAAKMRSQVFIPGF